MGSARVIAAVVLISAGLAQWAPRNLCSGQTRPAPPHQREAAPKPVTQQPAKPAKRLAIKDVRNRTRLSTNMDMAHLSLHATTETLRFSA